MNPAPDVDQGGFRRLRPALLGLAIEEAAGAQAYRLVRMEPDGSQGERAVVVLAGTLEACEERLLAELRQRHGRGRFNLPLPTLGGAQLWADVQVHCGWRIQQHVYTGHHRLLDARNRRRAWGGLDACRVALEDRRIQARLEPASRHLVLLLHGLFRTRNSLAKMRRAIAAAGFDVESIGYPSTRRTIQEHAEQVEAVLERLSGYERVSFVTHSLGGIVVRSLLSRDGPWKRRLSIGRLVMLGPPNRGSVIAEVASDWLLFELSAGDSGRQLAPVELEALSEPACEFGIIAGGTGRERGRNPLLAGDNDGIVTVESTRLASARDFLLVDALHSFLMNDRRAIEATVRFLREGRFAD